MGQQHEHDGADQFEQIGAGDDEPAIQAIGDLPGSSINTNGMNWASPMAPTYK